MKHLFFDAAGTLIELRESVGQTYSRIAATHGLNVDPIQLQQNFRTAWKTHPPVLHETGPSPDDDRSWWQSLVATTFAITLGKPLPDTTLLPLFHDLYHHFESPNAWQLFPDVLPTLQSLAPNYPLHILSNFDRRLHSILHGLGIHHFFTTITLSSEVGASKPHPRIFAHAQTQADITDPTHCLLVGDDQQCDHDGALLAGWHPYLLDRPQHTLGDLLKFLSRPASSN
ncbi:HAD-IA family hydrolase [Phragmitibacter flavus]|uniref:HAD-IA family hydrolase n=1 Tax=Phragmitibacter flavus TaxID=2576071 RepID=UPI00140C9627|nr:HAD-IA family hydrolase [Phragmitibacter flavus]